VVAAAAEAPAGVRKATSDAKQSMRADVDSSPDRRQPSDDRGGRLGAIRADPQAASGALSEFSGEAGSLDRP
jgi:hypothetical protein